MRLISVGLLVAVAFASSACSRFQTAAPPITQDGPYLVLEVDLAGNHETRLRDLSEQMATSLRTASIRYAARGADAEAARVRLADVADLPRALQTLGTITDGYKLTSGADGLIEARPTEESYQEIARNSVAQTAEVLRRRVDPEDRGTATVQPLGERRILIRFADVEARDFARGIVAPMAQVTFNLVHELDADQAALGRLPPGTYLAQPYAAEGGRAEVVVERPEFVGDRLASAAASTDAQTGEFVLAFQLDSDGTRRFCQVTREHTGERFAILIDRRVLTAPMINEPICGGRGQIAGNFTAQSAGDLAMLLRAGALPAPVRLIEEGVGAPRG